MLLLACAELGSLLLLHGVARPGPALLVPRPVSLDLMLSLHSMSQLGFTLFAPSFVDTDFSPSLQGVS